MAEILVRAENVTNPDPVIDARGCYKRGFPVVVMPDGHAWGAKEGLPKFFLFKLPTVPLSQVGKYLAEWLSGDVRQRRREWVIDVDLLPNGPLSILLATGILTIAFPGYNGPSDATWNQVRNRFRNARTGATE